jgi:salicylate hydroxylase
MTNAPLGADGIRSAVRPFVLPDSSIKPGPSGQSAYRMLVPISSIQAVPELAALGLNVPHLNNISSETRHIVAFPCRNDEYMNFVCYLRECILLEFYEES